MPTYTTKPLTPSTWDAFAALVEAHNGVWGGCWCLGFHAEGTERSSAEARRDKKCDLVRAGDAHAAVVFDGDAAVGWCQFGSPEELPRIKRRRAYEAEISEAPDWRITCFFVHKNYRGRGVAAAALAGALEQIAHHGGGVVESYPEDTTGREVQGRLLHNVSVDLFERNGFTKQRQIGKHAWVVRRTVQSD